MPQSHVLAIGLQNGGHNPNFLQWLAEGWAAEPSAGRLTLLVSADFAKQYAATAQTIVQADPARVALLPLTTQEQAELRALPRALTLPGIRPRAAQRVRRWREWQLCRHYAAQIDAGHVLFINLDFYQFAATWDPDFPCDFSGIFHNLMLHYPAVFPAKLTLKQHLRAALQAWSMRKFLGRSRITTLFCLDPYVVDTLNGWPGRHHAVVLPTPARPLDGAAGPGMVEELRRRHAIDPARRVFLMLGGIGPRRGIYPVLDALTRLDWREAQQVCLLIVGRQSDRQRLAQALAATQTRTTAQIVTHDTFIAESEIGAYYALADVALVTHVEHVGTSTSLVQAAAAGKPVLASDFGLLGEFTRRYGLGLAVDSSDPSAIAAALRAMLAHASDQFVDRAKAQCFVQANTVHAFLATLLAQLHCPTEPLSGYSMRHQFSQLTRSAWRFIQRLDDADIGILQVLPKQYKRAVVRRLLSIMPKAFPDGKISVDGVSIHVDGSDISRLQFETTQRDVATYLRHQLVSGMTFVDVGANVGFHTVLAAQIVGPRGHVHSIEPTEETIARLRENLELNQLTNVTVHDCAVGANPGVMTFYVRGGHGAQNSLFSDHLHGQAISSYPVTVRRLDEIVQGPVDVIKIDVEGGELEVLAGMTRILAESPKLCMVLEWCPVMQEKTGHGATQLPETLLAHGFAVDIISPFTAPLRTVDDIQAVLPRVIEQKAHMVDLAAVRS